jgi:hypothetical protein
MLHTTKTVVNFRSEKPPYRVIVQLGAGEDLQLFERTKVKIGEYTLRKAKHERFGDGLIAEAFLVEKIAYIKPTPTAKPHLYSKKIVTINDLLDGRVRPLSTSKDIMTASDYVSRFEAVRNFLDVENAPIFKPNSVSTYCNIYAYQFAHLMANLGGYIPRVWWINDTAKAAGVVQIVKTVREMNANSLFYWFLNESKNFNWRIGTPEDAKTHLTIAVVFEKNKTIVVNGKDKTKVGIGHIAVINPDGKTATEAGRNCYKVNPDWKRWFNSKKYSGSLIFTMKP